MPFIERYRSGELIRVPEQKLAAAENSIVFSELPWHPSTSKRRLETQYLSWEARIPLKDAVKGPQFLGRLTGITLQSHDDPLSLFYEERFPRSVQSNRTRYTSDNIVGFSLKATITTQRGTDICAIERPIWIGRLSETSAIATGVLWRRYVGEDRGENELANIYKRSVQCADAASTDPVSLYVQRQAMALPLDAQLEL